MDAAEDAEDVVVGYMFAWVDLYSETDSEVVEGGGESLDGGGGGSRLRVEACDWFCTCAHLCLFL